MISRNRSAPTAAAISIEWTTSANRTVTCLYSADRVACVTGAPHSLQNLEFGGSSVPHDPHGRPALSADTQEESHTRHAPTLYICESGPRDTGDLRRSSASLRCRMFRDSA